MVDKLNTDENWAFALRNQAKVYEKGLGRNKQVEKMVEKCIQTPEKMSYGLDVGIALT